MGIVFFVISDFAVYHYKQTKYYEGQKKQFTLNINDPFLKIKFPKKNLIISDRDKNAKFILNK
jgi:dTDP-4-dehydrorhamnose 3,5-epimerase-like enzyme